MLSGPRQRQNNPPAKCLIFNAKSKNDALYLGPRPKFLDSIFEVLLNLFLAGRSKAAREAQQVLQGFKPL